MTAIETLVMANIAVTLAVLAISVVNARQVGHDDHARTEAAEATDQAQYAHHRLTRHLSNDHGQDVQTAREALDAAERDRA